MLRIYSTLAKKKEVFKPRHSKRVDLFVCGPTVYDLAHIGHARTYIAFDIIVRYLRAQGYEVRYVQNITDIDDKIIVRARERGIAPQQLTHDIELTYRQDMERLGIESVTTYARATDYIPEIVSQVRRLLEKGCAYCIPGDGYYFDLKKFRAYGKLSGRTAIGAEDALSRIDESVGKRNKGDFCLWKFSKIGEPSWRAAIGEGRPGWHIEDTAITESLLGAQYDIHGGARDLVFPHHEAEIAQMESISGLSPLARYWMHTGFLTVDGKKMSKSLGNFVTIHDFLAKRSPETLRMLVASAHYRSPLDYSEKIAEQADEQLRRLREFAAKILHVESESKNSEKQDVVGNKLKEAEKTFHKEMADDFNTPKALAVLMTLARTINPYIEKNAVPKKTGEAVIAFLRSVDAIFGFGLLKNTEERIPDTTQKLLALREQARKEKKWAESDRLRKEIKKLGYAVDDTPQGPRIRKQL